MRKLLTILAEIEIVLNSRPLTYVSTDDLEEPLTPSHLLVGRQLMSLPDSLSVKHNINSNDEDNLLLEELKQLNSALDGLWSRWRQEYLLKLHKYMFIQV